MAPDLTRCTYDGLALAIKEALNRLLPGIARTARAWMKCEAWKYLGYARVDDHARESLSRSGRWLRDRAVLGDALQRLPVLERVLTGTDGRRALGQVAALALARFVTPESVEAWIALARRVPVRSLKQAIREAREQGSRWPLDDVARPASSGAVASSGVAETDPAGGESVAAGRSATASEPGAWRRTICMLMPAPVRDLVEDTRDLHSAVCGREQSLESLVESLIAETQAGCEAVDLGRFEPPRRTRCSVRRDIEANVYDSTGAWNHLPAGPRAEERRTIRMLVDVENLLHAAGVGDAVELDRQLSTFVELEDALQRELARILMILGAARAFRALDFTGLEHYAEQRLGLSRTTARDRVAVARAVAERSELARAYEEGRIGFEAVLLLIRFLRRDTAYFDVRAERAWIRHAGEVTLKRLRDEIRLRSRNRSEPGNHAWILPPTAREWYTSLRRGPGDTQARLRAVGERSGAMVGTKTVRFNLSSALAADFLIVVDGRRRQIEQVVCRVDGDREADGSTSFAWFPGPGSQGLARETDVGAHAGHRFSDDVESGSVRDESGHPGGHVVPRLFSTEGDRTPPVTTDDDTVALRVARQVAHRTGRIPMWVGLLAVLEDYISTWDDPRLMPWRPSRRIYERDGWRCAAPGCTSRRHLESHHIVYRSRGGDLKADENQVCLCRFHHQQGEHGSFAAVRGVAPLGLIWRLGSPRVGRFFRNERELRGANCDEEP
ncbi:MAG: HNH endonuclease [Acidobacteriota bacterium]